MEKIQWDDSLSVGVELIDDQHKMLIMKLIDLSNAVEEHQEAAFIMRTIDFLMEYSNYHFSAEEKEMERVGYPDIEEHKGYHKGFIEMIASLEQDMLEEGATRAIGESVNTFLWNWLANHIKEVDTKFGAYLRENR